MATRKRVYEAIDTERLLQQLMVQAKTGSMIEEQKPLESWSLYISDYADQLKSQLCRIWGPEAERKALDTIRKIAALCVAAMEMHGVQDREFPVMARINGDLTYIKPDMFGDAQVKREGTKVDFDPAAAPGQPGFCSDCYREARNTYSEHLRCAKHRPPKRQKRADKIIARRGSPSAKGPVKRKAMQARRKK